jgi:hypothetical protein
MKVIYVYLTQLPCGAADRVVELAPDLDPDVLAWGPLSGQRLACLSGSATAILRSLRRATADTLGLMIEDLRCSCRVGCYHTARMSG